MRKIKIIGTSTFLPGAPVSNDRMEEVFGVRRDWIEMMIGNRSRHLCIDLDSRKLTHRLSDLAEGASKAAIEDAELTADDIDVMIMTTATPDHLMPATVNIVADRLGINTVPTYQVQAGCSGAYQGVALADALLRSSEHTTALVVSGDACYKFLDFEKDYTNASASELVNLALFGDGAGAAVISSDETRPGLRIQRIANIFEGRNRKPGHVMHWFGPQPTGVWNADDPNFQSVYEDYKAIELDVPRMTKETLTLLLGSSYAMEMDYYLMPQLAAHMTRKIIDYCHINHDRTINCVEETGNTGNGLPFFLVDRAKRKMKAQERAVGVSIESSKWIKTAILLEQE
jgi:3-oxoacyl-[acyl-carrier-protein] synthase-3